MSTAEAFAITTPDGSDSAFDLDDQIKGDKTAIDERNALEHVSLISAAGENQDLATAAGRHKPGFVKAVLIDTLTNIQSAVSGTQYSGCLAYDTTNGRLLIHNGTNWTTYPLVPTTDASSLVFATYLSANTSVASSTLTKIQCNTEIYDSGSKYDNATNYRYTPGIAGVYHFDAVGYFTSLVDRAICRVYFYVTGSAYYASSAAASATASILLPLSADIKLGASDYVELYVYHTNRSSILLAGGTTKDTHWSGHLVSRT